MELQKFHETFNPILDILGDGNTIHHNTESGHRLEIYMK
jgi:hypothetical protein